MLYFRALIQGLDDIPAIDPAIRADIEAEAQRAGWPALHQQLSEIDPETASRLHRNHSQRICRALEVYRGTGTPLSEWQQGNPAPVSDDYECIALCPEDRAVLHAQIASRLDAMFDEGLVAEVTRLFERKGLHTVCPLFEQWVIARYGPTLRERLTWPPVVKRCWLRPGSSPSDS